MKKKLLITLLFVVMTMCLFAVAVSAETAYVNANGEQVEAGNADIAYEINVKNPFETGGNCNITEIYLYDSSIKKIIIPALKFTHSNGTEYDLSTYSYCRLAGSWNKTLAVYPISEKDSDTKTSLHTQITEIEFQVPVLADGAGSQGNLAGYSALQKLSFFAKAYEPQNKGGFLSDCTSLTEIHFYGQNNQLSGNFFCNSLTKVVFHKGSTSSIASTAMQAVNGKECTVYLNGDITPWDETDPRLTWNKNGDKLKFVILVDDTTGYTPEEIASYQTEWQAGNNKNANNYKYKMSIQTYCDFYKEHISQEAINDCVCYCSTCKNYGALANPTHALDFVIDYANGYNSEGLKTTMCTNEGCGHIESTQELKKLFETRGYSTDTTSLAIVLDFTANLAEIQEYESFLKKTNPEASIDFGVAVGAADKDDDTTNDKLFDENGERLDSTLVVDLPKNTYTNVEVKIMGIKNNDVNLHLSGYINVSGEITYINGAETNDYSAKVNYGMFITEE
ncbi:MAG: hypothetical protein IJD42_04055 [Clostridia bacterium]|nr:hypothetical protein [Clostridia bacterium]